MYESPERILLHRDKLAEIMKGKLVPPVTCDLEISWMCNQKCNWCVFRKYHKKKFLPLTSIDKALKFCNRYNVPWIILSGAGEPTIHPEFTEVLKLFQTHHLKFVLFTNGSNLNKYVHHFHPSLKYLRVSLDAATSSTYSKLHNTPKEIFDQILNSLIFIRKEYKTLHIGLSFVISKYNKNEIQDFIELASLIQANEVLFRNDISIKKKDIGYIRIKPPKRNHDIKINLRDCENWKLIPSICYGSYLKIVIDPDGNIPVCCSLRKQNEILGNINRTTIQDIWFSSHHKNLLSELDLFKCPPCRIKECNLMVENSIKDFKFIDII